MKQYISRIDLVRMLCKYANAEQIEIFDAVHCFEQNGSTLANGLKYNPVDLHHIKWNMSKYILDVYNDHCFHYIVLADTPCEQSDSGVCTGENCEAHSICGI